MAVRIQPARLGGLGAPVVRGYTPVSGATITRGAPIAIVSGEAQEHGGGATVTGLYGFAMQDVASSLTPDFGDEVQVAIANDQTEFLGTMINVTTVVTDLSAIEVGAQYGLLEVATIWYIDANDTSHVVIEITDVLDDRDLLVFKVIASAQGETV